MKEKLTWQAAKNISELFLGGKYSPKTVYAQLTGIRKLTPIVAEASELYHKERKFHQFTYEARIKEMAQLFRKHNELPPIVDGCQLNDLVDSFHGVDLEVCHA